MAKSFIWSILILTMPQRAAMLARLLAVLEPQICEGVELRIRESDPSLPVGQNREILRWNARGEYLCFIDDDDLVPPHYVKRILPQLLHPDGDGVDYVGFNLEQRRDGEFVLIERRSLRYGGVFHDGRGWFRDLSHLNPMRRDLALRAPMAGWPGEDARWADALRRLDVVRTEHVLDETLYYYLTRTRKPEFEDPNFPVSVGSDFLPWSYMTKIKVKMLTSIAGLANPDYDLPEHGFQAGDIAELHPKLAEAWVEAGIAALVHVHHKEPSVVARAPVAGDKVVTSGVAPPAAKVAPIAKMEKITVAGMDITAASEVETPAHAETASAGTSTSTAASSEPVAEKTASKTAKKSAKE